MCEVQRVWTLLMFVDYSVPRRRRPGRWQVELRRYERNDDNFLTPASRSIFVENLWIVFGNWVQTGARGDGML